MLNNNLSSLYYSMVSSSVLFYRPLGTRTTGAVDNAPTDATDTRRPAESRLVRPRVALTTSR